MSLRALAQVRTARPEEQVFHELLGDGGLHATAAAFLQVVLHRGPHLVPVEAVVLVEPRILGGNYRVLQIGPNRSSLTKTVSVCRYALLCIRASTAARCARR